MGFESFIRELSFRFFQTYLISEWSCWSKNTVETRMPLQYINMYRYKNIQNVG